MTMEDQYNIGDEVAVAGVTGVIEDVTMRVTRFRGLDGTLYVVPNGDIRLVGNLSRGWARAVCDLTLPGTAAADLDTVRSVIADAAHEVTQRPEFAGHATEPPQVVGLLAADSTTITMRVMLLTVPSQRDPLTRALREASIEALARAELWPAEPVPPAAPVAPGAAAPAAPSGSES
jgi:small conductance mechanosensitive channel